MLYIYLAASVRSRPQDFSRCVFTTQRLRTDIIIDAELMLFIVKRSIFSYVHKVGFLFFWNTQLVRRLYFFSHSREKVRIPKKLKNNLMNNAGFQKKNPTLCTCEKYYCMKFFRASCQAFFNLLCLSIGLFLSLLLPHPGCLRSPFVWQCLFRHRLLRLLLVLLAVCG